MLAYRHGFHAGNHGDVLKHLILAQVLAHMGAKDKPFRYIDTHAGAGMYLLADRFAQTTGEYLQGIARLWDRQDAPPVVAEYLALIRQFNLDDRNGNLLVSWRSNGCDVPRRQRRTRPDEDA